MSLRVTKAGILTTVQDLGRHGARRFGVNPNGAMDRTAVQIINLLLGGDENEAVLEMHFPAAEFVFEEPAFFAVGGADFGATLSGRSVSNWRPCRAAAGDVLRFAERRRGNRAYLAVRGGFRLERWLASASTNLLAATGGFAGRKLRVDDRLFFNRKRPRTKLSNSIFALLLH